MRLLLVLLLMNLVMGTAPSWVQPGLAVQYDGSEHVNGIPLSTITTYAVISRNANDIAVRVETASAENPLLRQTRVYHENPNAQSGSFWFDATSLQQVVVGQQIGPLGVASYGPVSVGGKDWLAVEFDNGAVFDRQTGLLLSNGARLRNVNRDLASYRQQIAPENYEAGEQVAVGDGPAGKLAQGACAFPYILLSVFGAVLLAGFYGRRTDAY